MFISGNFNCGLGGSDHRLGKIYLGESTVSWALEGKGLKVYYGWRSMLFSAIFYYNVLSKLSSLHCNIADTFIKFQCPGPCFPT